MTDLKLIGVGEGENKLGLLLQPKELLDNLYFKRYPYFGLKGGVLFIEYYVPRMDAQGAETGDFNKQRVYFTFARGKYELERPVSL